MRLLSGKLNTNSSSVQEQKEDHSSFDGQLHGKNSFILLVISIS